MKNVSVLGSTGSIGKQTLEVAAANPDKIKIRALAAHTLSLIHISEPTRLGMISYAVFCLKKKKNTCLL